MATSGIREAIALIVSNPELFQSALNDDGELDVSALETFAVRGDALVVIERKTSFSSDVPEATEDNEHPQSARDMFCDMLFALAAEVHAGVKKSGTSGDQRISVTTPAGKLTLVLTQED